MKTRLISSAIMLPFVLILYFGGWVLWATCLIVSLVGLYEFFKGFKALDIKPSYPIAVGSMVFLYMYYPMQQIFGDVPNIGVWIMVWLFLSVLASLLYMFNIDERKLEDGMSTIVGIVYVVFFCYHIFLVEQIGDISSQYADQNANFVWLIILASFGTDVFAYCAGMAFGKHKLCPKISPKKSIEGSIGGILGSVIVCGIFGYFLMPDFFIHCIVIAVLGGVVSQFGDLTASIFKRKMGIKDYGNLIPGHGGIMDRFDSVLFVAPMVFYYLFIVFNW